MTFKFDENLLTGINDIDEQHAQLFETIYILRNEDLDYGKKSKILIVLRDYVIKHFSTEENYMKKFGYPYYEEHKALHEKFTKDYNKLLLELAEKLSLATMVPSLSELLKGWLETHYQEADVKLADFLKERLGNLSKE